MMTRNRKHGTPTHAGSMADIAFLLLIFFMLTTTIVNDKGLTLLLPPHRDEIPEIPKKERNIYKILINSADGLFIENEPRESVKGLREEIKKFVLNYGKLPHFSESPKKAVVSIKTNRGTSQKAFIHVLDETKAAYYEIYAERAGVDPAEYRSLSGADPKYIQAQQGIPMQISIAEPTLN